MPERKNIYETGIKPLLEELKDVCNQHHIPMFCTFQDTEDTFRTTCVNEEYSRFEKIKLMWMAHQSWNIDDFLKLLVKDAREYGHSSKFLKAMGIPEAPPEPDSE
jgi:hypothetical protein